MKNVLIVGATSDIALNTAELFASNGYNLILAGRRVDTLAEVANGYKQKYGSEVKVESFDALSFDTHKDFFNRAVEAFGSLDGILVAHGYLGEQEKGQTDWNEARNILDINYTSVVSILNVAANYFEQKKAGWIACISSVAGDRGRQSNYLYGSAKAGVSAYLQGLRNRLSFAGVPVITIKPGPVATKMTANMDIKGKADPMDVAKGIYKAIQSKKNVVYLPWKWSGIMFVIRSIPETLFKRLKL